jgi:hypothetical protein
MVALRAHASEQELQALLQRAVVNKPKGHRLSEAIAPHARVMAQIGG